jgi:hypothetical protein
MPWLARPLVPVWQGLFGADCSDGLKMESKNYRSQRSKGWQRQAWWIVS